MKTYTKDELGKILADHKLYLDGNGGKRANLSGSDLRGSNLSDSNLRGSDLSGSNLSGINLSHSNLSDSDLSGSDLSGSDLSHSNLRHSNLRHSNLSGSNMSYSDLRSSNLRGTGLLIVTTSYAAICYPDGRLRYGCEERKMDAWLKICDERSRYHHAEDPDRYANEIRAIIDMYRCCSTRTDEQSPAPRKTL